MGRMMEGFILMIGQILEKLFIIILVISICYAGYALWKEFIKTTQKHTRSAAVARARKQGFNVK